MIMTGNQIWFSGTEITGQSKNNRGVYEQNIRAQLKRIEEERDILKKAARYFAREPD